MVDGSSLIGQVISHYSIVEKIGAGGMGEVYRAHDQHLERDVALKILPAGTLRSENDRRRFRNEALALSKLNHPNIAAVYDFDSQDGVEFLVMELVLGETLSAKLKKGCLPEQEVLRLGAQLAEGLGAAHAKGIVHRDLKPSNLMITAEGRLKILDFGLAMLLDVTGDPNVTQSLAETTVWAGTLPYMAPERLRGERADKRTDIYAVGTVLYEMATGQRAFPEANGPKLIHNILHHSPSSPHKVNHQVTPELESKILKAMDKCPERRYQSSEELLADLVASDRSVPKQVWPNAVVRIGRPNARRAVGAILALGLVLVAGIEVYRWRVRSHDIIRAASTVAPAPIAGLPPFDRGKYVAVLPFNEHDETVRFSYLADTLGGSLARRLENVEGIVVVDTKPYDDPVNRPSFVEAARVLAANLVVNGSVHEVGDTIRVSVTLDDAVDSKRLWAGDFSGSSKDLLRLEDQIYFKLVEALQPQKHTELSRNIGQPTGDAEAYDLYLRGLSTLQAQAPQAAMKLFAAATKQDPSFGLAYIAMANYSLSLFEKDKKGKSSLKQALHYAALAERANPNTAEVHFTLASIYTAAGRNEQSITELKRAQEIVPNSDEGYRRLGNAYLTAGQHEQAIHALEKAVELNPYYWVNQNALGNAYLKTGEYEKALKNFQQVTQLAPQNQIGFTNLGIVYVSMGRYEESIAPLEASIRLNPQPWMISNLGTSYFYLHRYSEAVKQFEKAVELNPNDETMTGNLGDAYRAAGQMDKAKATYDKAIALCFKALQANPRSATTMGSLALYYAKKSNSKEALKYIRQARTIDPTSLELIFTEAEVDTLTDHMHEASIAMEEAFRAGATPTTFASDPELRALRNSPEFERIWKQFRDSKNSGRSN